jgi:hypothetical protein
MEESPTERLILVVQDNPDHTRLIKDASYIDSDPMQMLHKNVGV